MAIGGTRLKVSVAVECSASNFGESITDKWRPTVEYSGRSYPGFIIVCDCPIFPGDSGNLILEILHSDDISFVKGDDFNLLEGSRLIAKGVVKSVIV